MKQNLYSAIVLACCGVAPLTVFGGQTEVTNMRCEYQVAPLGVDAPAPRLTWEYSGESLPEGRISVDLSTDSTFSKGVRQIKCLTPFSATVAGKTGLKPGTRYFWRVRNNGTEGKTVISPVAKFETGKLRPDGRTWKARWISDGKSREEAVAPMFIKTFTLDENPEDSRAYVSAAGYYDMYINGRRIGDHHMDPGYTDYTKRSLYAVHDVTPYLRKGENVVEITLGNGFSNVQLEEAWSQQNAHWRDRPQLICEITDHGKTVAATDRTWQTRLSPTVYNCIYSGDHIDARLRNSGAETTDATEVDPRAGILTSQQQPAIRPTEEIIPELLRSFGDTLFIYDMGKNIAGVCDIRLKGSEGTRVKVRHGEILKSNGRVERGNIDIYYHPGRDDEEFQTDTYFLSGNPEGDSFHPRFTYHGFRYAEVLSDAPVSVEEIKGEFMRTALPRTGSFSCSNDLLNRIYDATMLSYEGNIHSIPTDCPQREKNGWTADAHAAVDLGLLNYDGITFYEKWMRDVADSQNESGNIPGIIPSPGWGYGEWPGPVWDAVLFIIPTALYDYYGDATCLKELYPTMVKYFGWVKPLKKEEGILTNGIGDWLSPSTQTTTDFTSTLYYYADNKMMARICRILGEDPTPYETEAEAAAKVINNRFFDAGKGVYAGGTPAAQGIALYWDVVPEEWRQKVADNLNDMIVANGYDCDFGLLGSKSVLRMLTKYGHADTAFRLATQTSGHSWGYWLEKNGQTTLGETWTMDPNFRDASLNHVFFGDIAAWMTNDLAGLNPDPERPGFEHVIIRPTFVDGLDNARADYHSVKGPVSVAWSRLADGDIELVAEVPAGVSATLLPGTAMEKEFTGKLRTRIPAKR